MTRPSMSSIAGPAFLVFLSQTAAATPLRCTDTACPQVLAQAATAPDSAAAAPTAPGGDGATPAAPSPDPGAPTTTPAPPTTATPAPQAAAPNATTTTPATPAPALGTLRNTNLPNGAAPGLDPQFYGGTLSSPGRPQGSLLPPYGGTQRNTGMSAYDNAQPAAGMAPYGGTQSTIGTPQFSGAIYGRPQATPGARSASPTRSLTGTTLPGNAADATRAPLGSSPITRDQIGAFGGQGGYTAQGVYTGVAGQAIGYGQPYASSGRPVGGVLSNGTDATGPLRPYVPLDTGRNGGPTNSGYGIPNGSRPTTMDARGVQRMN